MKNLKIIIPCTLLFLSINSCEQKSGYAEEDSAVTEAVATSEINAEESEVPLSSTAATYQHSKRKFIRTADLSMEVENVYKSTTDIEKKLSEMGGFVTKSKLESQVISNEIFPIDADSAKEVKKYTVRNMMTVRVPQMELGDFLLSLGDEIKFLNFRNISAEDVSLNFVMSELEKERLDKTSGKLDKITEENGKITDKQNIVNNVDEKKSEINYNKISTLKLKDDVAFSSVTLLLTEKEKIAETMVINPATYDDKYRAEFGYRAGNSIKDGFYFFQTILIGFLYLWPLWVSLFLILIGWKWFGKRIRTS